MYFNFTNILEVCLIFLILNSKLASGKKKKVPRNSGSGEIDEWTPPTEKPLPITPIRIDYRGLIRESFALRLASEDSSKNSVCSPISALLPLGKLVLGASGKTQAELLTAIGHSNDEFKSELKELIEGLKQLPGVTLTVVSKIYIPREKHLNPHFAKESKQLFQSSIEKADFSNPKEIVQTINTWVKTHTNGMIPDLLSASDMPRNPSLVLVNAVYFQGNWLRPFMPAGTVPFHSPMGTRRVPMMTVAGSYNYVKDESLNVQILEIPYNNKNASFLVVLPVDKDGLPMLLTALKLAPKLLNKAIKKMTTQHVKVMIPKFKVTSKINLQDIFQKIGVKRVFLKGKELDKIVLKEHVHVSSAIQQAVLEVTETGTEAGAATATIWATAGGGEELTFIADKPFLFYVLFSGQQIFAGTYNSV